jgi:colanic acid/amylovoran biosynthesis protein
MMIISKKYNVKPDSVGIIPNMQVYKYLGKDKFIELYVKIINKLILDGKNIYIIRHSTEDLELCNLLKDNFSNKNVFFIVEDLYAQELENIISQLEFIVASRYHSIIHGYKHYIPAVVLGWAQKYNSLLNYFDQSQYLIDCRYNLNLIDILDKITDMEKNITRNKKIIQKKSVFESVEEYL